MLRKLALSLTILCAGCQPPPPYVIVVREARKLVFHVRERGFFADRIFGWDDRRVRVQELAIAAGDQVLWRYVRERRRNACAESETFPIYLGERRCGYRASGNVATIMAGQVYEVRLHSPDCVADICRDREEWWSGDVVGRFRINDNGTVINFRPD